jgi:hypothetical protein
MRRARDRQFLERLDLQLNSRVASWTPAKNSRIPLAPTLAPSIAATGETSSTSGAHSAR